MTILGLLILVVVVCLFVYIIQSWAPPAPVRNILFAVVTLVVLLWLLNGMGVFGGPWLNRHL